MSIFDKFLDIMKLNDDDDYDDDFYDDDDFYEDDYEERPRRSFFNNKKTNSKDNYDDFDMQQDNSRMPAPASNVTPMRQPASRRGGNSAGMEVCVVKPISVDDSGDYGNTSFRTYSYIESGRNGSGDRAEDHRLYFRRYVRYQWKSSEDFQLYFPRYPDECRYYRGFTGSSQRLYGTADCKGQILR